MSKKFSGVFLVAAGWALALAASAGAQTDTTRLVAWGTWLNPQTVTAQAKALADSLANPASAQWRAKGDQKRSYRFAAANATVNYRIVIPTTWDGVSKLPLILFLHSGGGNENTNLDANSQQLVKLALQHGYALVSPLGYQGAYGFHLRLPAVFGQQAAATQQMAAVTPAAERTNQLSEIDVVNVLEIVLREYPIERTRMFLAGHSMGAGGTWYLGAKYPAYWAALAPLSGPFVLEAGYPWENIRPMPNFITEGSNTQSTTASRAVHAYMAANDFKVKYKEVVADHEGMIPLVLPDMFAFFDTLAKTPAAIAPGSGPSLKGMDYSAAWIDARTLRITLPSNLGSVSSLRIFNAAGDEQRVGTLSPENGAILLRGLRLAPGVYEAEVRTQATRGSARFRVMR